MTVLSDPTGLGTDSELQVQEFNGESATNYLVGRIKIFSARRCRLLLPKPGRVLTAVRSPLLSGVQVTLPTPRDGLMPHATRCDMDRMSEEEPDPPEPFKSAQHIRVGPVEAEDPTVVERDPDQRFHRYDEQIARGRFKTVFRGYDTHNGIDVAWCKVTDPDSLSTSQTLDRIFIEMRKGLALDHSSIIKCFACWIDHKFHCINLITELFTSGTLRQYYDQYRNIDINVYRKNVRQILRGLAYLHAQNPPIVHADLRLDKIYVNGFNGEVKIGDLGLATLLARRYESKLPEFDSPSEDLFALGLCVYELLTGTRIDRMTSISVDQILHLQNIRNPEARDFIEKCTKQIAGLSAETLLDHPFLKSKTKGIVFKNERNFAVGRSESIGQSSGTKLRGEDYNFEFQGYESDTDKTSLHVRLFMSNEDESEHVKILNFDYSLEKDTPESVGGDIADSFNLSYTDRELCKAGLREWLAGMEASKPKSENDNSI